MTVGVLKLGTHTLPFDLQQMVRRPINSMRQTQDQGVQQGEQSLDNSALWRRKQDDFVLGQGQRMFDQTDENSRRRVRAYSGFDPLDDRGTLAVAPTCAAGAVAAYAGGTAGQPKLLKTRSNWWAIPTTTGIIKRTASHTSFTTTNVTGTTAALDATVNGDTVYIADGLSVFSGSITGSSVSSFSTVDTDVIDAVKGRLIAGHNNEMFELSSAGAKIEIYTHPNTAWDWVDFCGGSVGIYCAGHDGRKSEVYLSTLLDATGAIEPPASVMELPAGELIRCMDFFSGFLVLGTNRGFRLAQSTQSGLLNYGPIIELGEVYGVAFEDRFAYATCVALPTFGGPGVVKLSIDRFTAPYTPAYAGSFPITASGYTPYDVGVVAEKPVCLLGNGTNVQVAATASAYGTAQAYSGLITFGIDELKNVRSAEVRFDALTSGQSVTLSICDKQGGSVLATTSTSTVGATTLSLSGFTEILREDYELFLQAVGQVTIRRWTTRAVPAPAIQPDELIVPFLLHRSVILEDGSKLELDPYTEWTYLKSLALTRSTVSMIFGSETVNVWIDQNGWEGTMDHWETYGRWPEGLVVTRLVTAP